VATEQLQSTEHDQRVDYIELAVTSVPDAKRFYGAVFGWRFEDYGPDYASFADFRDLDENAWVLQERSQHST